MTWQGKWNLFKKLSPGGQGDAYLVKKPGNDQETFFLKELRDNRKERRHRMRREVGCYQTLKHPLIPQLVDTNIHLFDDDTVVPYLVTNFIDGSSLTEIIRSNVITSSDAIIITCALLNVVQYAHSQETVHRDIKPDNIILEQNNPHSPVLVDFGMSFYEGEDHLTPQGQELGNRFLRLPEYSIGSSDQRSPRSDVTLSAGILFALLTGIYPRQLRDEHNLPPHQNPDGRAALALRTDIDMLALLNIFDRAFDPSLHVRWDSADELKAALNKVSVGTTPLNIQTADDAVAQIAILMNNHREQSLAERLQFLNLFYRLLSNARDIFGKELTGFSLTGGNNQFSPVEGIVTGMIGIVKASDNSVGYRPNYKCEIQGNEYVLTFDGENVFRGKIDQVLIDEPKFQKAVRDIMAFKLVQSLQ